MPGPKPSCFCGACRTCRKRESSRRMAKARGHYPQKGIRNPGLALRWALSDYCRGMEDATVVLAELTGLSPRTVSAIRLGRRQPDLHELDVLSLAIGLHPDLLFVYERPPLRKRGEVAA